jgi:hypothetical protein
MIFTKVKRVSVLITLILSFSMLVSSCNLLPGGSKEKDNTASDIEDVVSSYLDEMQDGTLVEEDYASDYAKDTPFADLELEDSDVQELMNVSLTMIEYEIDDAEGDIDDEEGTCDFVLTYIDLAAILDDLGDGYDANDVMDAIEDKDAPTEEADISLDLEYDEDEEEWLIADTSELAEILGEPFGEVSFAPDFGEPTETINSFLVALANADAAAIDELSPSTGYYSFYSDEDNISMNMSFYSLITYEVNGEPTYTDNYAEIPVTMTLPDVLLISSDVVNDTEYMATLLKDILLASINGEDTIAAEDAMLLELESTMTNMLYDPYYTYSVDAYFGLEGDVDTGAWIISAVPYELYDMDAEPENSEQAYTNAVLRALEMLLAEGSIDQATYDLFVEAYVTPAA